MAVVWSQDSLLVVMAVSWWRRVGRSGEGKLENKGEILHDRTGNNK